MTIPRIESSRLANPESRRALDQLPTPLHREPALRRIVHGAAHLALWAGMYVTGAVVLLAQITGMDTEVSTGARIAAAGYALCTATGVYLLDRVKVRDRWLDPADAQAHAERFAFLTDRAGPVRALALTLLLVAAGIGALGHPALAIAPLVAAVGVIAYAGRPRRTHPRPKDILIVKNTYVAAGITGFAALVVVVGARPEASVAMLGHVVIDHAVPLALGCILVAIRVFADAVVCDLDDEVSDRQQGTGTLPTRLGRRRAWDIAFGVRLGIAVAMAVIPVFPLPDRLAWAGVTVASSFALRLINPSRVRDWVDARLAAEALTVTAILSLWNLL